MFGSVTSEEIYALLDDHVHQQLGSQIARLRFRAGRIDAVWGVDLDDGRAVVIKTHRPPADLESLRVRRPARANSRGGWTWQMGRATVTGQLVLLCGKSFSGKSTVGLSLAGALSAGVVSLDAINAKRGLWGGDGIPISEWARTNDMAHERVRAHLRAGETVIVDDTSSPRFLRDGWRAEAKAVDAAMALVFVDTSDELRRQWLQKNRSHQYRGDVTDEVVAAHEEGFERPGEDEHFIRAQPDPASLEDLASAVRRALSRSC